MNRIKCCICQPVNNFFLFFFRINDPEILRELLGEFFLFRNLSVLFENVKKIMYFYVFNKCIINVQPFSKYAVGKSKVDL